LLVVTARPVTTAEDECRAPEARERIGARLPAFVREAHPNFDLSVKVLASLSAPDSPVFGPHADENVVVGASRRRAAPRGQSVGVAACEAKARFGQPVQAATFRSSRCDSTTPSSAEHLSPLGTPGSQPRVLGTCTPRGSVLSSSAHKCGLTSRSSGPATAWHPGREAPRYMLHLAARAPCRIGPLNSNVRPHNQPPPRSS
jgi:hypothetical protein